MGEPAHRHAPPNNAAIRNRLPTRPSPSPPLSPEPQMPSPHSDIIQTPQSSRGGAPGLEIVQLPAEFSARYRVLEELGSGGYGYVHAGLRSLDGTFARTDNVAIKFISRNRMGEHDCSIVPGVPNEAYILHAINHPNVIRFYELFTTPTHFIMVSQFVFVTSAH